MPVSQLRHLPVLGSVLPGAISVVYRGRALPIIWRVLKHDSVSVAFEAYREMLCQEAQRLLAKILYL